MSFPSPPERSGRGGYRFDNLDAASDYADGLENNGFRVEFAHEKDPMTAKESWFVKGHLSVVYWEIPKHNEKTETEAQEVRSSESKGEGTTDHGDLGPAS